MSRKSDLYIKQIIDIMFMTTQYLNIKLVSGTINQLVFVYNTHFISNLLPHVGSREVAGVVMTVYPSALCPDEWDFVQIYRGLPERRP